MVKWILPAVLWSTTLFTPTPAEAQIPTQSIRGQVTDDVTGLPIPGVTVMVLDQEPTIGTTTDMEGNFFLTEVPVGRQTLRFSYIGYEARFVRNLLVTSAREVILNVTLRESVTELDELVVQPNRAKDEAINRMATTSARVLSMEEASRYAGGFDDPARLATSFPGVAGNLADNAIVIRGNAPKGLLWRMEGIEIPAPSHFGNIITMGGGGITALSSEMIANSDFYTGAFPAEYGNALSGVFDLNIRNGNNQHYEHTARAGTIGLDIASEGPLPIGTGNDDASILYSREQIQSETGKLTVKSEADFRIASRHTNRTGFTASRLGYNQQIRFSDDPSSPLGIITDETDHTWLYQVYTQSQFYHGAFTLTGGLHLQHFALTGSTSVVV